MARHYYNIGRATKAEARRIEKIKRKASLYFDRHKNFIMQKYNENIGIHEALSQYNKIWQTRKAKQQFIQTSINVAQNNNLTSSQAIKKIMNTRLFKSNNEIWEDFKETRIKNIKEFSGLNKRELKEKLNIKYTESLNKYYIKDESNPEVSYLGDISSGTYYRIDESNSLTPVITLVGGIFK